VPGPVAIQRISRKGDDKRKPIDLPNGAKALNHTIRKPVLSASVADTVTSILESVVQSGTAVRAQIPGQFAAGKTGTTENYGDAWFVGWNSKITVAVWVGYPDKLVPMRSEFNGQPVAGGTYPAGIWRTFVEAAMRFGYKQKEPKPPAVVVPASPGTTAAPPAATPAPAPATPAPQPAAPTPAPATQAPPAQQPNPPAATGGAAPG
jgi:penicillin-binding protein 1A